MNTFNNESLNALLSSNQEMGTKRTVLMKHYRTTNLKGSGRSTSMNVQTGEATIRDDPYHSGKIKAIQMLPQEAMTKSDLDLSDLINPQNVIR